MRVDHVRREGSRLAGELEMERPSSTGRAELAIRCRDLEALWLAAGIRRQLEALEAQVRIDREVRESGERLALVLGDRAAVAVVEVVVLLGAEGLDRLRVVDRLVLVLVFVLVVVLVVVLVLVIVVMLVVVRHDADATPRAGPSAVP